MSISIHPPPAARAKSPLPESDRRSQRPSNRAPRLRVSRRPLPEGVAFVPHVPRELRPRPAARLRAVFALCAALGASALFGLSLTLPWWKFKLYAPQYPHGLTLVISLRGLSGDVREIDMLNHYIGMGHLDAAAVFERRYAVYAVAALCVAVVTLCVFAGKKLGRFIVVAGAAFPLGFLADSFYWLYRFGHALDPRAPLHIPAFTPQLFGNGSIGQFMTFALPEPGFWAAVAGAALLGVAVLLRGGASVFRAFVPTQNRISLRPASGASG